MRSFLFLIVFLFITLAASGQTDKIAALKNNIAVAKNSKEKLAGMLHLFDEYQTLPKDTLWNYALEAKALATSIKDTFAFSVAIAAQANAYLRWNNTDSAKALIDEELLKYKVHNAGNIAIYFKLKSLRIDCIADNSDYKDAMPDVYSLMEEAEKYKDSVVMAESLNTLAAWNYDMDFLAQSRSLYYKALAYTTNAARFNSVATIIYINMADYYRWLKNPDSATYCINKAITLGQSVENLYYLSAARQRLASIYIEKKDYAKAEASILLSLQLSQQTEGKVPQQEKLMVLASVYEKSGDIDKAIKVLKDGLAQDSLFREHSPHRKKGSNAQDLSRIFYYQELASCYKLKGDDKEYEHMLELIITGKDAFYKANAADAMAELETKYELRKKETTIAQQKLELIKKNYIFYGLLIFLLLSGIIAWLIFRDVRRNQKIKLQQLSDDEKRLATQAVQEAEEQERKRIAADLHDNLGAQLSFIKRNVNYIMDQPEGFSQVDERKYLGYVNDVAQSAMIDLRETIWVLNKDSVHIQEFADKLKSYLRQHLLDKDKIKWNFVENITHDWELSSGEVMQMFRIVQEVISNVIKHADADTITVQLDSAGINCYRLAIADNGKGFQLNEKQEGHYGLENIEQRSKEISAALLVESAAGSGTKITLIRGEK
ncbi:MAG: ATP-binding protein [Ferruginibacter sp.]